MLVCSVYQPKKNNDSYNSIVLKYFLFSPFGIYHTFSVIVLLLLIALSLWQSILKLFDPTVFFWKVSLPIYDVNKSHFLLQVLTKKWASLYERHEKVWSATKDGKANCELGYWGLPYVTSHIKGISPLTLFLGPEKWQK